MDSAQIHFLSELSCLVGSKCDVVHKEFTNHEKQKNIVDNDIVDISDVKF